jgi:hypothetical protein
MKNLLLLILFAAMTNIYGQNRLIVSVNPGLYLHNSENSLQVGDQYKIVSCPGFSTAFEKDNILGFKVHLEYNFNYYSKTGMHDFYWYELNPPIIQGHKDAANYFLTSHNFDLSLLFNLFRYFNYYLGPSLAVYNRTIEFPQGVIASRIYDNLVSYCVGLNGAMNFNYPLSDDKNYFFLYAGLKFRYLHSFMFDARGRNLGNYFQSFLTAQLNLGIGYNF